MGAEVYSTEDFLEAVKNAEEGEHIVFVDESSPREINTQELKKFEEVERIAKKKGIHTSLVGAPYELTVQQSQSHQQAFSDLSMIERTVLDFLENLKEGADSDLKAAIDRVEEGIVNGA